MPVEAKEIDTVTKEWKIYLKSMVQRGSRTVNEWDLEETKKARAESLKKKAVKASIENSIYAQIIRDVLAANECQNE